MDDLDQGASRGPEQLHVEDFLLPLSDQFKRVRSALPTHSARDLLIHLIIVRAELYSQNPELYLGPEKVPAEWGEGPYRRAPIDEVIEFHRWGLASLLEDPEALNAIGYEVSESSQDQDVFLQWLDPFLQDMFEQIRQDMARTQRNFDHPVHNLIQEAAGVSPEDYLDPIVALVRKYELKRRDLLPDYPEVFQQQWKEEFEAFAPVLTKSIKWQAHVRDTAKGCFGRQDPSTCDEVESALFEALCLADGTQQLAKFIPGDSEHGVGLGMSYVLGWADVWKVSKRLREVEKKRVSIDPVDPADEDVLSPDKAVEMIQLQRDVRELRSKLEEGGSPAELAAFEKLMNEELSQKEVAKQHGVTTDQLRHALGIVEERLRRDLRSHSEG